MSTSTVKTLRAEVKRGRKRFRCPAHPFKQSDLATGQNQEVLAAREEFVSTVESLEVGDYDGLQSAVEEFQSALDDYVALREEALDAWENGNSMLEELLETAEQAVTDAEEARSRADDEYDEEEPTIEDTDEDSEDRAADLETLREEWESAAEQAWDDTLQECRDLVSGIEV